MLKSLNTIFLIFDSLKLHQWCGSKTMNDGQPAVMLAKHAGTDDKPAVIESLSASRVKEYNR